MPVNASATASVAPATPGFTLSGFEPVHPTPIDPKLAPTPTGGLRHGTRGGPADLRLFGGHFVFDFPDTALPVTLLAVLVPVRGLDRLDLLLRWLAEEARGRQFSTAFGHDVGQPPGRHARQAH
ncbi:MAG: hypothetical protein WAQ05_22865 [Rubrivivax sp.]